MNALFWKSIIFWLKLVNSVDPDLCYCYYKKTYGKMINFTIWVLNMRILLYPPLLYGQATHLPYYDSYHALWAVGLELNAQRMQLHYTTLHWTRGECVLLCRSHLRLSPFGLSSVGHSHSWVLVCLSSKHGTTHRPQSHFLQEYVVFFSFGTHDSLSLLL
jgi:hypothetical protein